MKIVIASHNSGKLKEFRDILEPLGFEVVSVKDLGVDMSDIEEIYDTFEGNALLKAKVISKRVNAIVVADDSGIVIPALPDILGVYSARFMGEDTEYATKNQTILQLMEAQEDRSAYFVSAIALVDGDQEHVFMGRVDGTIAPSILGSEGFGYDPIFVPDGYDHSYSQMSGELKNQMSHRALALKDMVSYLKDQY